MNYMLLLRYVDLGMKIDNVIVMWIAIEKWWIESDYEWLVLAFDWFVYWCWEVMKWYMFRWGLRCWVVNDERMIWAIEIVDLKFVELDWIDELCELFVFDGNELIV